MARPELPASLASGATVLGMAWLDDVWAVHSTSDRLAAVDETGAVTGRELIGKAMHAAEVLTSLEPRPGAPVPALLTTNSDALALLLGGAAANRPLAPMGPRLTARELARTVAGLGGRVIVTESRWYETAAEAATLAGAGVHLVPNLRSSAARLPRARGELAFQLHTSGTTGEPKRVPFTEDVLTARVTVSAEVIGLGPDHRYATGSPLHHIAGLGNVLTALSVGATVLSTTQFSTAWWRGMRDVGATHCLLVPTMIEMLLTERMLDVVPLHTLIYGAAPMSPETLRRVLHTLPAVALVSIFGQTEGSPIATLDSADHHRAAAGRPELLDTVGRAAPGLSLRIDGADAAGTGEVLAAAPYLSIHDEDGWLHTGDLGALDSEGYLRLSGRRNDMVVRGGENVYPLEVEHVLVEHPGVAGVGVVGVPDQRLGETLAAFVVPTDATHSPDHDELASFTRARLAGFKVPAHWYDVTELPLNHAGKLLRPKLLELHLNAIARS
jgi:acyl-CoA synthetase (AMP-forming)/AMP-acid ligase II